MEENMKKMEAQLQTQVKDLRPKNEGTTVKIDELGKKLDLLMEKLLPAQDGILGVPQEIQSMVLGPAVGPGSASPQRLGCAPKAVTSLLE